MWPAPFSRYNAGLRIRARFVSTIMRCAPVLSSAFHRGCGRSTWLRILGSTLPPGLGSHAPLFDGVLGTRAASHVAAIAAIATVGKRPVPGDPRRAKLAWDRVDTKPHWAGGEDAAAVWLAGAGDGNAASGQSLPAGEATSTGGGLDRLPQDRDQDGDRFYGATAREGCQPDQVHTSFMPTYRAASRRVPARTDSATDPPVPAALFAVADGVGGWGPISGLASRALMEYSLRMAHDRDSLLPLHDKQALLLDPALHTLASDRSPVGQRQHSAAQATAPLVDTVTHSLARLAEAIQVEVDRPSNSVAFPIAPLARGGSTTLLLARLSSDGCLAAVNYGDSSFLVIRPRDPDQYWRERLGGAPAHVVAASAAPAAGSHPGETGHLGGTEHPATLVWGDSIPALGQRSGDLAPSCVLELPLSDPGASSDPDGQSPRLDLATVHVPFVSRPGGPLLPFGGTPTSVVPLLDAGAPPCPTPRLGRPRPVSGRGDNSNSHPLERWFLAGYGHTASHANTAPVQLAPGLAAGGDSPLAAQRSVTQVASGDLVVLGTDGLFDNLWAWQIATLALAVGAPDLSSWTVRYSELLVRASIAASYGPQAWYPFLDRLAQHLPTPSPAANTILQPRHDYQIPGFWPYNSPFAAEYPVPSMGKPDDVTVIVAVVTHSPTPPIP